MQTGCIFLRGMVPYTNPNVKHASAMRHNICGILCDCKSPLCAKRLGDSRSVSYNTPMPISPSDKRYKLCCQLQDYARRHPERRSEAERILRFVESTSDCFERSHESGHITGSAWLLNPDGTKALLTLHRKLGLWLQPGGHADGQTDTLQVALREAEEESGIAGIEPISAEIYDVDVHRIPPHPASGAPEHLHYDVRYLLRAPHENYRISHESKALAWFTPEELHHLTPPTDESVLRLAGLCRR